MKKILLLSVFAFFGFNIQSQMNVTPHFTNITVENIGVFLSTNTTTEGESVLIGSDLTISNVGNLSTDCLFEFNYLIDNGAVANVSLPEVVSIPTNATSFTTGPLAIGNYTFPNQGLINISVQAVALNCTITNGPTVFGFGNLLVMARAPIPTMGQWGIMILGILIVVLGVLKSKEQQQTVIA